MKDSTRRAAKIASLSIVLGNAGHPSRPVRDIVYEIKAEKYEDECKAMDIDFTPRRSKKGKRLKDWQ